MNSKCAFRAASLVLAASLLAACGGGGGDSTPPPSNPPPPPPPPAAQTYTVGGTVAGLASGGSVVLQNNGGNDLTVSANGNFTFSTQLNSGSAYAVTVATAPTTPGPGQDCSVANGGGTVGSANVSNVAITCQNEDQIAPTTTARTPTAGANGTKVQGGFITVTFSEPIDKATVTSTTFNVQNSAGAVGGTITFNSDNTQAIFTPAVTLPFDDTYTVRVTTGVRDPSGNALPGEASWSFNTGKKLALGFTHSCARLDDGQVKCWGRNNFGQLGYDDTTNRANGVGPSLSSLLAVNLGAGRTAVALTAGDLHTCAILDNGDAKCWGQNTSGQLGQGSTAHIGDGAGEMAALQPINFGAGRTVLEIAAGQNFTCARLDDNTVKCWGNNLDGQLGQGNRTSLGIAAGDIAAAAPIDFGSGLTPVLISLGHFHGCAILTDSAGANHTKCWGDNYWGQVGLSAGNNTPVNPHLCTGALDCIGDQPGEMGSALPDVNLGTGLTASYVVATGGHNCAKLSDASVKCWGLNTWGQVGLSAGNNTPADKQKCVGALDCIGDQPGELGDTLTAAIVAGSTAKLAVGYRHNCVLTTANEVKCWGTNEESQTGLGDITGNNVRIGDQAGEMAVLIPTALKPGKVIEELTAGGFHTCVFNTDDTLNCWGLNSFGQLGINSINNVGDTPVEMGAGLIDVDLGT